MKKIILYAIWLFLYALCAGLGFVEEAEGLQAAALTAMALIFFIPGLLLLIDARKTGDKKGLRLLRWICITVLSLSLIFLVANIFSALGSEALGDMLYQALIFVSVPMICGRSWFLSLFLWACLLFGTFPPRKK
jgi:hypothetical protein